MRLIMPLLEHEKRHAEKDGRWFINADNYKSATDSALQAKLNACSAGTALAHMVYENDRWRDAKMNWTGKQLKELGAAAQYLHSGELAIDKTTLKIKDLRNAATIDLCGQGLTPQDATVVATLIAANR